MYHKVEKMNSLATLENEKAVCDKIIEYKKKINADYDDWEMKKDNINLRIENIQTSIEGGLWDLDRYKKEILNQYKYEIKLLQFIDKDKNLKDQQKKALKERIEENKEASKLITNFQEKVDFLRSAVKALETKLQNMQDEYMNNIAEIEKEAIKTKHEFDKQFEVKLLFDPRLVVKF